MPGSAPDIAALGLQLLGDDLKEIGAAAQELAGTQGGFTLLWAALIHRPGNARAIIPALAESPVEVLIAAATQSLSAGPPDARAAIVHVLSGVRDRRASELIAGALEDVEVLVRIAALRTLAERGQAVPHAVIRCRTDAAIEVRLAAVGVLMEVRTGEAVDHLIHFAADPAPEVRKAARSALGERRVEEVARSSMRALRDPLMRRAATSVLGDLGAAGAPFLVTELESAPKEVRGTLEEALRIGGGVERSRQDLRHPSAGTRIGAVHLLSVLGATEAVTELIDALGDPSPEVRIAVIQALVSSDVEGASATRVKEVFLGDPDLRVVEAAEKALRAMDRDQA